jgi:hypothetical protein
MLTHAQNPFAEPASEGRIRVHFAARDAENRARGGYFEISEDDPTRVLRVSDTPTLDLGPLGAFDDSGVMPSSVSGIGGRQYMYYTGWTRAVTVPFSFHIGLAVSDDGGERYERASLAPVLGRNRHDPFIVGAPYVRFENGRFRMWYASATSWVADPDTGRPRHYYTIKHAHSADGLDWTTSADLCIPYGPDEYALARPVVFEQGAGYRMWFSFRGGEATYRVGTASSPDGLRWRRDPRPLDIDVSESGWDSEMICYAHPLRCGERLFALYNGNDYGRTGIGLAVFEGGEAVA